MPEIQTVVNQAKIATEKIINVMTGLKFNFDESSIPGENEIQSYGISSIVNFCGKAKGRMLLDLEHSLALYLSHRITGGNYTTACNTMVLETIAELNNTISGDLVTELNNKYELSLRLSPPIVFSGEHVTIAVPRLTSESLTGSTVHGKILLSIGLEGVPAR